MPSFDDVKSVAMKAAKGVGTTITGGVVALVGSQETFGQETLPQKPDQTKNEYKAKPGELKPELGPLSQAIKEPREVIVFDSETGLHTLYLDFRESMDPDDGPLYAVQNKSSVPLSAGGIQEFRKELVKMEERLIKAILQLGEKAEALKELEGTVKTLDSELDGVAGRTQLALEMALKKLKDEYNFADRSEKNLSSNTKPVTGELAIGHLQQKEESSPAQDESSTKALDQIKSLYGEGSNSDRREQERRLNRIFEGSKRLMNERSNELIEKLEQLPPPMSQDKGN